MAQRRNGDRRARRPVDPSRESATSSGATLPIGSPWRWAMGALAAAVLVYVGVSAARRESALARLPNLPDLARQSEAIRGHVIAADRAARAAGVSANAIGALCVVYHADMFYDQAEQCYAVAESLDPGTWRWTYYRALVHGARGNNAALADALRRVTAAAPDFSTAWWQLGEADFKAGRLDRARDAWRRAIDLPEPARPAASAGAPARVAVAPIAAYATLGLARLALSEGHADRAREMLERVTTGAPRFGPGFRLLGSAYAALGRPGAADRMVRAADRLPAYDPYVDPTNDLLARESRNSTFLLQQASAADVSTNGAWREHLIRRALQVDPGNKDALFELASLLRVFKRYDEALALLQQYARQVPGDYQAMADIGRCLSGLQRYGEAEGVLRRALDGSDDANTRYDLGRVMERLGKSADGLAEYRRALERNPNHRDALNNFAVALARLGKLGDSVGPFEHLVTIEPDNADAHVNLGGVLVALRRFDEAERHFRAALAIDPDHARARAGLKEIRQ